MKSQPKIEAMATPRPWNYSQDEIYIKDGGKYHLVASTDSDSFHEKERNANAALIVKAVNQLEALEAVAIQMGAWMNFLEERSGDERGLQKTRESLANLEAVRKEGK